ANSKIIVNAHRINNGQEPLTDINTATLSDFYFIPALSVDDIRIKLIKIISERIPIRFELDAVTDVQVLSPMNKGGLGTRSLNIELQKHLNIHAAPSVTRFGQTFCRGDKVIQTVNNYDKEIF